jgi:hypothetical protein
MFEVVAVVEGALVVVVVVTGEAVVKAVMAIDAVIDAVVVVIVVLVVVVVVARKESGLPSPSSVVSSRMARSNTSRRSTFTLCP